MAQPSPDADDVTPAAFSDEWKTTVLNTINDFLDGLDLADIEGGLDLEEQIAGHLYENEITAASLRLKLSER